MQGCRGAVRRDSSGGCLIAGGSCLLLGKEPLRDMRCTAVIGASRQVIRFGAGLFIDMPLDALAIWTIAVIFLFILWLIRGGIGCCIGGVYRFWSRRGGGN